MLPDEVTKLMGQVGDIVVMEIERGAIKKYAKAIDDNSPQYWDDEYARNSNYGSIVAPPGFFGWPVRWEGNMPVISKLSEKLVHILVQAGYSRLVDGGIEYEFHSLVRSGDILAALPRIISITTRETKAGHMVFSIIETSYTNQYGNLVAKSRQTFVAGKSENPRN